MRLWSDAEFQRVARHTRLAARTLEACHDVMVDGMSGADAARKHKLFHAQVSRSVRALHDRQEAMVNSAVEITIDNEALLKFTVLQIAKKMMGDKFEIVEASPGATYEGPIMNNSHGFLVQRVGRSGVLHDVGVFASPPPLNCPLLITYAKDGLTATATKSERAPEPEFNPSRRREDMSR